MVLLICYCVILMQTVDFPKFVVYDYGVTLNEAKMCTQNSLVGGHLIKTSRKVVGTF